MDSQQEDTVKNNMRFTSFITTAVGALLLSAAMVGCNGGDSKTTDATKPGDAGTKSSGSGDAGGAVRPAVTADGNKADGNTIPIGVVASLSGDLLPWGQDELKGAQLAVQEFNAAGGVNGKKIDLKYEDSTSKAEQGKSAAEKLISEGVIGIVGEVASGITAQIATSAFEKGIPVVAVGATKTDLTNIGANVFRVCYTDDFQGPVMAKFAYDQLHLRSVALITDKAQPYSTFLSTKFRDYFVKLGGTIVDEEFYQSKDTNFKGILTNVKAKNPDGLFMSGYFPEVGPLARQAKEVGLAVPMLGGDGWDSKDILTGGGDAIVGQFFCNHYNNQEDRPVVKEFLAKWAKAYPQESIPGTTMGALGYDAMMMTCQALKTAAGLDSKSLIAALDNVENFHGVSGDITLKGNNGNPPKRALVVTLDPKVGGNGQKFVKAYEHGDITP
jgi:branched-chain amino acid transport system substrate-binding protein